MMSHLRMPPTVVRQRGVVLIFSLIILVILTIGAVALMRSSNSTLLNAGNLAFRRDLVNQGEQAVSNVLVAFRTGGTLSLVSTTDSDLLSANYKANTLPTNSQGVPNVLLNNGAFPGTAPDLIGATPDVTIRYIIDRLCNPPAGPASSILCVQSTGLPQGGTFNRNQSIPAPTATVYRLSVRVSGPRNTQVFLQTTFTKPD